jgi:DNA-binding NarL/FixJ family response regulator
VFASVAAVTDAAGRKVGVVGALMEFAGPLSLPGLPALGAPSEDNLRAAARLTPRQFDVLGLIMRGYANKRIARELGVETGTVRMHVNAILKTLDVRNRTEAALIGTQLALSGPPELAARLRGGG